MISGERNKIMENLRARPTATRVRSVSRKSLTRLGALTDLITFGTSISAWI